MLPLDRVEVFCRAFGRGRLAALLMLATASCAGPERARPKPPTETPWPEAAKPLSTCPLASALAIPKALPAASVAAPSSSASPPSETARAAPGDKAHDVDAYHQLAEQLETHFLDGVVGRWYPRLVDKVHGGFGPHVGFDFAPLADNGKFLVFQSRMTWVAAEVALRYPTRRADFLSYTMHGVAFLNQKMWDPKEGGFFWETDENGRPLTTEKHAYGMAFAIYAASAAARATGDRRALDLAMKTFDWLEARAHDDAHGGYYEALTREGKPILAPHGDSKIDGIGTVYGRKSMNTHIHLLEAFTALYQACGGEQVKKRLAEVFYLVRDRIADRDGFLTLFFTPDWRPIPDDDSYGHDVETAYLLSEAAAALGMASDATTQAVSRRLVDHALTFGWDDAHGGFYDKGSPGGKATGLEKIWWVQAEGMNGLLLMHERYGSQTDRYYRAFLKEWDFVDRFSIDKKNGDWFSEVGPAGEPENPRQDKGGKWKDPYHQGRALMECIERLRHLGEHAAPSAPAKP
jgi:mannobiose 2-epimerase